MDQSKNKSKLIMEYEFFLCVLPIIGVLGSRTQPHIYKELLLPIE